MAKRIALDELIDGIEMQSDDVTSYFDRDEATVVAINEDISLLARRDQHDERPNWERELVEIAREIENGSKRYVQLPSKWEVHEWDMMRRFSNAVEDERVQDSLLRQIQGRGAFRRFKIELERNGRLDQWFQFKRNALREHAVDWCRENDVPFDDDAASSRSVS